MNWDEKCLNKGQQTSITPGLSTSSCYLLLVKRLCSYPETMRRLTNAKRATGWYRNGSRWFSTAIAFNTHMWVHVRKTRWTHRIFYLFICSRMCILYRLYNNNNNKILTIVLYPCPCQPLDLSFHIFPFEKFLSFFSIGLVRLVQKVKNGIIRPSEMCFLSSTLPLLHG